jgi:hypothetical protein
MLGRLAALALVALMTIPGTASAAAIGPPKACVYVGNPNSIKDTHVSTSETCGSGMRTASIQVDDGGVTACVRNAKEHDCFEFELLIQQRVTDRLSPTLDQADLLP